MRNYIRMTLLQKLLINLFIVFIGLLPVVAGAQQCPQITSNVIIFGGRGSTTVEMKQCYPEFFAISHDEGSKLVNCLAQQINERKLQKFVIAGHSSGAGDAENLVRLIQDKSRLHLILLEGFAFSIAQRGPVNTTCWYAENSALGIRGFNAPSMLNPNNCPQPAKAFEAGWCKTEFCNHVSHVNTNVEPELNRSNVLTDGLKNCRGNIEWLKGI